MPLIGICAARETASWTVWNRQPAVLVGDAYVRSVQNAGADVVLIAPTPTPNVGILDQLDGLLLPGGVDVDPAAYGAELEPGCEDIDPDRDSFELALTRSALERNIPVLGICRGMQVINVALGGTLQQDVEAQLGKAHRPALGSLAEDSAHPVEFAEGSLCAEIAKSASGTVRSHHHQAVANAGKGVRIAATSALDGICEAIEVEGCDFAIGVQWHAEATPGDRFIPAFVTASAGGAS
jgi:putative glutamine amidotransferase